MRFCTQIWRKGALGARAVGLRAIRILSPVRFVTLIALRPFGKKGVSWNRAKLKTSRLKKSGGGESRGKFFNVVL